MYAQSLVGIALALCVLGAVFFACNANGPQCPDCSAHAQN